MDSIRVLKTAEPLENGMLIWRRLYWVTLIFLIGGIFYTPLLGIGMLYVLVCYLLNNSITKIKRAALRDMKFKFLPNISYDDIFAKLQTALISNYGSDFMLERDKNGGITISYAGMIYDIILKEDYFRIYWRMSVGKAVFSINEYKIYRKILIAMGIIGYELQKEYEIQ
jgi:hypothetical protein